MGYDFMFMSLGSKLQVSFPSEYSDGLSEWAAIKQEEIIARLHKLGANENGPDTLRFQPSTYDYLDLRVSDSIVSVDVHADWLHVMTLYRELRSIDPDLLVFDEQTGTFHDEHSFAEFVGV